MGLIKTVEVCNNAGMHDNPCFFFFFYSPGQPILKGGLQMLKLLPGLQRSFSSGPLLWAWPSLCAQLCFVPASLLLESLRLLQRNRSKATAVLHAFKKIPVPTIAVVNATDLAGKSSLFFFPHVCTLLPFALHCTSHATCKKIILALSHAHKKLGCD